MQDQLSRPALVVCFESDLGVYDFVEVISIAFRKYFELGLPSGLDEQVIALASDR
jgi:hypothetical protein